MASISQSLRRLKLEQISYPQMEETIHKLPLDENSQKYYPIVAPCAGIPFKLTEQFYRLQTILGKGTFGIVSLAKDKKSGQVVAIKTLKGVEGVNPRDLREVQFFREVVPHPGLVSMGEMYIDSLTREVNFVLEVMDFNLLDMIHARRGNPLDPKVVQSLSVQLLQGIAHLHALDFVHRDLKPENLLLKRGLGEGKGLVVKIADFGLSRRVYSQGIDTVWSGYVATRWYRAPEQLLGVPDHGFPLDVWAFGTVLAELCNLKPLFPGRDILDMVNRQLGVLGSPSESNYCGTWLQAPGSDHERHIQVLMDRQEASKPHYVSGPEFRVFDKVVKACLQWDPNRRPSPERILAYLRHKVMEPELMIRSVRPVRSQVRSNSA